MSLSLVVSDHFKRAVESDESLEAVPTMSVGLDTMGSILKPVEDMMSGDPAYAVQGFNLSDEIEELRRMCVEAQAAHTTSNLDIKEERNSLLNTLQSLKEKVEEAQAQSLSDIDLTPDEVLQVSRISNSVGGISIYFNFNNQLGVAQALEAVAHNFATEFSARPVLAEGLTL